MENKVIYQIYPKSFKDTNGDGIGDINGIIEKIEYINELGVDYIWLTPILCSPQNDNGYDISDYCQIDQIFGTMKDYKRLIDLATELDIKIMFDLVLNHVSTEHEWFQKAISGDAFYHDFFVWSDKPNELESAFGTNAWTYIESLDKYYLHLFDVTQADLNWHNPNVRKTLYEMINSWINLGVNGFRLDVIDLIAKEPEKLMTTRGPRFIEYLNELVNNTFKGDMLTVGECWNFGPDNTVDITGDSGLTQVFHFSHLDWIYPKWGTPKISIDKLTEVMNKWQQNPEVIEALVLNNHDIPRIQSYWFGPSENTMENYYKCTSLFALNLLSKGNTYIYQGEEIGMQNAYNFKLNDYNDIETKNKIIELENSGISEEDILRLMHEVSRDNARTPMKWNSSEKYHGFSTSKPWLKFSECSISIEEDLNAEHSIYSMYKQMIAWKKENYNQFSNYSATVINDYIKISSGNYICYINPTAHKIQLDKSNMQIVLSNYDSSKSGLRSYEFIIQRIDEYNH